MPPGPATFRLDSDNRLLSGSDGDRGAVATAAHDHHGWFLIELADTDAAVLSAATRQMDRFYQYGDPTK